MKKLILAFLFFSVSSSVFTQETKLKLGSDVWPPFTNIPTERSIALDIVNKALSRIEIEITQEIVEFEQVLKGIHDGWLDGSGALWKTDEREEYLTFSKSYLENRLVLVGLRGMDVSIRSIPELTNRKIGLVANYGYDESLLNAENLEIVYSESDQQNLEKLFDKKIDYMLVDQLLIEYLTKYQVNDVKKYLSIAEEPFYIKSLHLALRKEYPDAQRIIEKFNTEIDIMISDGSYNKILGLDCIQSDIDGDGIIELIFNGESIGEEKPNRAYTVFYEMAYNNEQTNFYINGDRYKSWDDVPNKYKKRVSFQVSDDIYDPGLRIKF